jgi:predicted regulator of Ras-like GTPase activity (Roadblock/LC7/MglB family)
MALVGNLKDLKLTNIVQLNCMEKNEAVFTLDLRQKVGKIYFADGNIVHATFGNVEGEAAVHQILRIKEGPFKVENDIPPPKRTITTPWSNLLLEGLRIIDEATEAKGDALSKFSKDIKSVNGVNGVLICSINGEILMEEGIANGKRASAAMAFIARKIEKIGRAAKAGTFKTAIIGGKTERKMVSKWNEDVVELNIDTKASVDVIEQSLLKAESAPR